MPYFATKDNVKIYYEDRGSGEAVVLIHGWSCSRHAFKYQVPELVKNHRVISYDLRGHGDSDRPEKGLTMAQYAQDLKELMNFLNLDKFSLVGWSMGTHIIFEYLKQFGSSDLEKICFVDMAPKLITDENWDLGLYGDFDHQANLELLATLTADWDGFVDEFVPALFSENDNYDQETVNWLKKEARKNTPHVMINMWIAMVSQDYRDLLNQIDIPTLITYGEDSSLYSSENSEYLNENIANSKLVPFADCGHALILENPDKFNKELISFLKNFE